MVSSLSVIVLLVGLAPIHGLKCNEGFNMSLNGLPFYHWKERSCTERSKCVIQQIGIDVSLNGKSCSLHVPDWALKKNPFVFLRITCIHLLRARID